jgi:hypothetical protein
VQRGGCDDDPEKDVEEVKSGQEEVEREERVRLQTDVRLGLDCVFHDLDRDEGPPRSAAPARSSRGVLRRSTTRVSTASAASHPLVTGTRVLMQPRMASNCARPAAKTSG